MSEQARHLARIEAALARIEAVARRPVARPDTQLRERTTAALAELDAIIARVTR